MNDWNERLLHTHEENKERIEALVLKIAGNADNTIKVQYWNVVESATYRFLYVQTHCQVSAFNDFEFDFDIQIDDLETLRAASEDDLRKAGLKMGDIIKIRKLLAEVSESSQSNISSESSLMSNESEVLDDRSASSGISSETSTKCTKVWDFPA